MENGFVTTEEVVVSVKDVEEQTHAASWMILWSGYFLATFACGIQVWIDKKKNDQAASDEEQAGAHSREGNETSSGDITRSSVSVVVRSVQLCSSVLEKMLKCQPSSLLFVA
jgi:hypothetical protein